MTWTNSTTAAALAAALLALAPAPAYARTVCSLTYQVSGWSFFFNTASGTGRISCDNGQAADVAIRVRGGGLTAGITEIEGEGTFTAVRDIDDLFGSYGSAGAHAGIVRSSEAHVVTKGPISLALSGTGRGIDLGVSFGRFEIIPREGHRRTDAPRDESHAELRRDQY